MITKPNRAVELSIAIGADTDKDAIDSLNQIIFELETRGVRGGMTSGSPAAGWFVELLRHPEMTHDKYIEQLTLYLEQQKRNGNEPHST